MATKPTSTRGDASSKSRNAAAASSVTDTKRGSGPAQPQAPSQLNQPLAAQPKANIGSGSRRGGTTTCEVKSDLKKKEQHKSGDLVGPEAESVSEVTPAAKDGGARTLAWSFFTADQLQELDLLDLDALLPKVAELLCMSNWKEDLQTNILLGFHFNNYLFAKENRFRALQISTFLAIMKQTLDKAIEEGWTMTRSIGYFRTLLLNHSGVKPVEAENGPWSVFDSEQGRLIADYAMSTIYQHYKLYRLVFTTEQNMLKIEKTIKLEAPPLPTPLCEAMTLEEYEFDQMRKAHEAEFQEIAQLPSSNLLEHPEAAIEQTSFKPLDVLPPDAVRDIVQRSIQDMIGAVVKSFQNQVEEHRARIMTRLAAIEMGIINGGRASIATTKLKASSRQNVNEPAGNKNAGPKGGGSTVG